MERAGQVQLGGEVGIAESARGDSVIVGAAPRTGSQAREKKKRARATSEELVPVGWRAPPLLHNRGGKAPLGSSAKRDRRYLCCTPGCRRRSFFLVRHARAAVLMFVP